MSILSLLPVVEGAVFFVAAGFVIFEITFVLPVDFFVQVEILFALCLEMAFLVVVSNQA